MRLAPRQASLLVTTVGRHAGDGVMVVFNDPVPVENPALQAVLMALELREALRMEADSKAGDAKHLTPFNELAVIF
jgi:class 3 adenylate cyclase